MAETAPKPTKLRISLNLLHPKEAPLGLPQKFLKWLISYGRFIVIFVEIIVVGAFLARFKLDADLDRLKQQINLDLPYVEGFATTEAEIKQIQAKLGIIDKVYLNADRWQEAVVDLAAQTPLSVQFGNLVLNDKDENAVEFKLVATTFSNADLGVFLNNLRAQKTLSEVNLSSITFDKQQIQFTISGIKKNK